MPIIRRQEDPQAQGPYSRLRLKSNHFPPNPFIRPNARDPRSNGSIFADGCRREVISRFERVLICAQDFESRARLALLWSEGDKRGGERERPHC